MILVNTVQNPNLLTQSVGKLSHRENPCLFLVFLGSSPDRGRSPVEWGDFPFVRRATFMETLRWDNFCYFGATLLRFGTLFTNIILLYFRNSEKNRTTPTPKKNQKNPKKDLWIFMMGYLANALSRDVNFY